MRVLDIGFPSLIVTSKTELAIGSVGGSNTFPSLIVTSKTLVFTNGPKESQAVSIPHSHF